MAPRLITRAISGTAINFTSGRWITLPGTGARVQHYAGNYVYFSRYHDYWWGYQYTGHEVYGQLLSAKNVLQATFLIEDDGYSYGGSRNLDLQSWRDQYSWSYGYWYGWAWGYVDLVNHYGSWSGLITP
jgi:hypothetical protein